MVSVLFYTLSVVLSLSASTHALTSLEVCHKIRDNQIKILALGSRGYRDGPGNHWVYLLADGGYLFVVPFENLTLNLNIAAGNRLKLGGDYKDANKLFSEKAEIFTVKGPSQIRYQKFSFITNDKNQHFLIRMYGPPSSEDDCYELYPLDGGPKTEHECYKDEHIGSLANFLLSMDSTEKPNGHTDQWTMIEVRRYEVGPEVMRSAYVIKAVEDKVKVDAHPNSQYGRLSPSQSDIVTAFTLISDDSAILVLVSDTGKVTIGQRKYLSSDNVGFESSVVQPLNEFVQCVMRDKVTTTPQVMTSSSPVTVVTNPPSTMSTSTVANDSDYYEWWIYALAAILILFIGGLAIYCCKKQRREARYEQRKMKWLAQVHKTQNNNTSSDIESNKPSQVDKSSGVKSTITTTASSTVNSSAQKSGILSTITNKIKSMVARSAKSTNKAKKDKAKKKKKEVKKSKANKEPPKSSFDGQEPGSSTS